MRAGTGWPLDAAQPQGGNAHSTPAAQPRGDGRRAPDKPRGRSKPRAELSAKWVEAICQRLRQDRRVRRTLPGDGRLHIDRRLPFLCLYRRPPGVVDAGTELLVKGEASYLIAPSAAELQPGLSRLVSAIVRSMSAEFGAFLLVEIWAGREGGPANDPAVPTAAPRFDIYAPATRKLSRTLAALQKQLKRVKVLKQHVDVEVHDQPGHNPDMTPLLNRDEATDLGCALLGLAVPPVYRAPGSAAAFPLLARSLRRSLTLALRQAYFEFVRDNTTHRPSHYHALGRRAVVKAVWEIDRQLARVSDRFDYLLHVSPVNAKHAWEQFQASRMEHEPEFYYRPLPIDPDLLKRELYRIPIERVEDPALQRLFQEKQQEIDLKLTMLRERETDRFLYYSLALFGGVRSDMLARAHDVLRRVPPPDPGEHGTMVDAASFAQHAQAQVALYRRASVAFAATVEVTDAVNGVMVSRGRLLINNQLSLPQQRIEALLAHEVGTHLVTYYNGQLQPFRQLYCGLADYEPLQEGLAVLAEHLVGGLGRGRARQLAARVVAVSAMIDGATFVETFRRLNDELGLGRRSAFAITMRVYRAGGLTKDAVYLRGLEELLKYLRTGNELAPLLVGKMALKHVPIIRELQYRKVLQPAAITPHYLAPANANTKLQRLCDEDITLADLIDDCPGTTKV